MRKNVIAFLIIIMASGSLMNLFAANDKPEQDDVRVRTYTYPRICPSSDEYRLFVNGEEVFVYYTEAGSFAAFDAEGILDIEIQTSMPVKEMEILPLRLGIEPEIGVHSIKFQMEAPGKLLCEIPEREQLFIYANDMDTEKPSPGDKNVIYFKEGQVYETGLLRLEDNQTLYIEGGAVVRGSVHATSARNVKIAGKGVLDHGYFDGVRGRPRFVLYEDCLNSSIEGIIMIEPNSWMVTLYHSSNIQINDLKQLGSGHGSDGIDIVGTDNVLIENSMLRNGDDCIVVKSFERPQYAETRLNTWDGVQNVMVRNCALQSNGGGQAFEIGHELTKGPIMNIRFTNCDVMGVHGQGGVFGIHNSDDAHIQNVIYEDIRVDHFYNKLVDLRIIKSRWTKDEDRGSASNIHFKNIDIRESIYNPGYSISLIGGYDENHKITNVTFENFVLGGKKIMNADEMDLYIKQAEGVVFK